MIRLCNKLETMAKEKGAGSYLPLCPSNRTQSMQLNIALLYLSLIWALRHRWSPQKAQWYRVVQLNKIVDAKQRHVNQGHPYAGRTHKDTVWMAPYLVYTLYLPSVVTLIAQLKYFHQTRFVPLTLSQNWSHIQPMQNLCFHFAAKTCCRSGRSSLFNPVWCFTPSGSSVLSPHSL